MVKRRERAAVRAPRSAPGSGLSGRSGWVTATVGRLLAALEVCGISRQACALRERRRLAAL